MAAYGSSMGRDELNILNVQLQEYWRGWRSVTGRWWYLRRLRSSPPVVHRYPTRAELIREMRLRAAEQERWDTAHN